MEGNNLKSTDELQRAQKPPVATKFSAVVHGFSKGSKVSDSERDSWASKTLKTTTYHAHILDHKGSSEILRCFLSEEICILLFPGEVGVGLKPKSLNLLGKHSINELQP